MIIRISFDEYNQISTDLNRVTAMMQNRNASEDEIFTVQELQSDLDKFYAHSGKLQLI